jgi:tetratricopeptide (TPR) repeat protein
MRYKGTELPLAQIGRELGVDAVVEGSVLWSGDRVRISANLSATGADRTLWAGSYERELRDVLALQRELSRAIAQEIKGKLTPDEQARLGAADQVDPEAYEAYLRGRQLMSREEEGDVRKAIEQFQLALARSPRYAAAYAGLSDAYRSLGSVAVGRPSPEMKELATRAARRALQLDERLADAHRSLAVGNMQTWRWAEAERSLRRAIELDPSNAPARRSLAQYLVFFERNDEAVDEARRAEALDPFSASSAERLGMVLFCARRYDDALVAYRRAQELNPRQPAAHWWLGLVHAEKGHFDEAIREHEEAMALSHRSPAHLGSLGGVYARRGQRARARAVIEELRSRAERSYVTPAAFVFVYTGLGDKERAFEWLEKAAEDQTNLIQFLRVLPTLDPLRSDPRFEAMLRRFGLKP